MEAVVEPIKIQSGYEVFAEGFAEGIQPIPDQNIWQWADEHIWLAGEAAAEPGKFHSSRTPYMREVMECLSPQSIVDIVVGMMSTQIAKTLNGQIAMGYYTHRRPWPMAAYLPRDTDAANHSKLKMQPMINATPVLRARMVDGVPRSDNTVHTKLFPGGLIKFLGAEAEASFRHMSYGFIHASEITSWPHDIEGQGDPTTLLLKRMDTYTGHGSKLYLESSPTLHKLCRIERWFLDSDQSYYFVPCPLCGHYQTLVWPQIKYKRDDNYNLIPIAKGLQAEPMYECESCNRLFAEDHKEAIMAYGVAEWRPTNPDIKHIRGFHLNSLYSPFVSWNIIVKEWIRANKEKDRTQLIAFTNTRLAETWKEDVEVQDADRLASHREAYPAEVPAGVCMLTASVDVQGDRLEVEVKGWGPGMESWGIEHRVLIGSPKFDDVWRDLDAFIFDTRFQHELGIKMKITGTGIDTGYEKDIVYEYIKKRKGRRVFALKGRGGDYPTLKGPNKDKTYGINLYSVGTNAAKERVIGWLSIDEPGPGYCHFADSYSLSFFDQFENFYVVTKKGIREFIDKAGKPVEALDLFVYNRAVLEIFDVNLDKIYTSMLLQVDALKEGTPVPTNKKVRRVRVKRPGA